MKKCDIKKLAILGLTSGLFVSSQSFAIQSDVLSQIDMQIARGGCGSHGCNGQDSHTQNSPGRDRRFAANVPAEQKDQQVKSHQMLTEEDLVLHLNAEGKATYQSLSPEGKAMALKLANQSCKGKNSCKGLNSCKTEKNSCAGKGSCAGQSMGPFTDKNMAVKVAAQKMAEKRNNSMKK